MLLKLLFLLCFFLTLTSHSIAQMSARDFFGKNKITPSMERDFDNLAPEAKKYVAEHLRKIGKWKFPQSFSSPSEKTKWRINTIIDPQYYARHAIFFESYQNKSILPANASGYSAPIPKIYYCTNYVTEKNKKAYKANAIDNDKFKLPRKMFSVGRFPEPSSHNNKMKGELLLTYRDDNYAIVTRRFRVQSRYNKNEFAQPENTIVETHLAIPSELTDVDIGEPFKISKEYEDVVFFRVSSEIFHPPIKVIDNNGTKRGVHEMKPVTYLAGVKEFLDKYARKIAKFDHPL